MPVRVAFPLSIMFLAVIAFCCGNIGPDVANWVGSLF